MANTIPGLGTWRRDPDVEAGDLAAGPPDDPSTTERAARAAANARYQAFVSSPPTDEQCKAYGAPGHDFDQCVGVRVEDPVLFQPEGHDVDAVDPRDVRQGALGDCYFLASLAALAGTPRGRSLISSAIVENKNDRGESVGWTVTLHRPESHLFGPKTFCDEHVSVAGMYVVGHAEARHGNNGDEVWVALFEKAYAQYAGSYDAIGHGGDPAAAMQVLTGRDATSVSLGWPARLFRSYGVDELQRDLASGKMIVLSTVAGVGPIPGYRATASGDAHPLIGSHAYYVRGVAQHNGKPYVMLGNPWANADPQAVPFDQLSRWFSKVSIGAVP